jgi:hypothetical protein
MISDLYTPDTDRRPIVSINIMNLINDVQCDQSACELRCLDAVACLSCESQPVMKRGFDKRLTGHDVFLSFLFNKVNLPVAPLFF